MDETEMLKGDTTRSGPFMTSLDHMARGFWFPYLVGLVGFVLLFTAGVRFFWFYSGASLLVPAATCLAAAVAGFVGLKGVLTWTDQLRRDRLEKNREAAELYMSAAMKHLPSARGEEMEKLLPGRIAAVLWGSDETAEAAWTFATHVATAATASSDASDNDEAFGRLMLSLRRELRGETSLSAEQLVQTVFIQKPAETKNGDPSS